jgi:nucleoside phosphorylase
VWDNVQRIETHRRAFRKFKFPGAERDYLYPPEYGHQSPDLSCDDGKCDPTLRITRSTDAEDAEECIVVHRGTIASGGLVVKDAVLRDNLARQDSLLCFEMEAAGALMDFPCLVVRGISDYCDLHKNDLWHGYAAAVAAAYARQLFFHLPIEETLA